MKIYITGVLTLLVYFPIFILILKKDFRERFSKINSKKLFYLSIEFIAGILYFLIILFSFFKPIKINFIMVVGVLFYFAGILLTYRGYYIFYKEKGLITKDVFSLSRNPTYFFSFVAILGVVLMTSSLTLLGLHLVLFLFTDRIIVNEEKYLMEKYRTKYLDYRKKVRRYV